MSGFVAPRPRLPEGRNRAINETRVGGRQGLEVDAKSFGNTRTKRLHDDIDFFCQREERPFARIRFEIERDALFAPLRIAEHHGLTALLPGERLSRAGGLRRMRILNLNDPCAVIGHQLRGRWAWQKQREIENG